VIKVEPLTGDPMRRLYRTMSGSREDKCPPFDMFNRGKRSLAMNINAEGSAAVLDRVIASADVFLTNMRPSFLTRVGLDADQLLERYPRIVYASLSGYGPVGPDKDAPGFDVAAFTARSGIGERMQPPGGAPTSLPGGMGDVVSGMSLVAGICGALLARERTGRGQIVTTSLLRSGVFSIGMDVSARVGLGRVATVKTRENVSNPLMNCYPTGDGSWFWLMGAESEKHWPRIVESVNDASLADDERFASPRERRRNAPELVARLDAIFRTRPRAEWGQIFDEHDVWWTPLNAVNDLLDDPQLLASGALGPGTDEGDESDEVRVIASPVDFSAAPIGLPVRGPEIGADTVGILDELAFEAEDIAALAKAGIVATRPPTDQP
jgi:crotonobetainyl-CoA:carnitine CoA-transferase CaiB-like acyl-CoA transferase